MAFSRKFAVHKCQITYEQIVNNIALG